MRNGEQGRATDARTGRYPRGDGKSRWHRRWMPSSRNVRVVLIRAGEAKSGRVFTPQALADIAAAADGLRCFADHPTALEDRLRPARSVRDIVGVFRTPRLVGNGGEAMRVEASLHVLEHADWLWQLVKEVVQLGEKDVIGLSIDALCTLGHRKSRRANGADRGIGAGVEELRRCHASQRRWRVLGHRGVYDGGEQEAAAAGRPHGRPSPAPYRGDSAPTHCEQQRRKRSERTNCGCRSWNPDRTARGP